MAHASKISDISPAIWPCAQRSSQSQRKGRYLPESYRHPGKMLPELARRAIETYSDPGDLIVDPMCGIGTTIAEAIHLDRDAIGVELEQRWSDVASANIAHARSQGAPGRARILTGDARQLPRLLTRKAARELRTPVETTVAHLPHASADLVVTSPPYASEVAEPDKSAFHTDRDIRLARNYSHDKRNIGHARGRSYADAMLDIYRACATITKPGGFVVVVTKDMRASGALRDLAGITISLCEVAGLQYWQRVIGLLATVRGDELIPRPSFWQLLQTRRAMARGERTLLVSHEDVLVFRRPVDAKPERQVSR